MIPIADTVALHRRKRCQPMKLSLKRLASLAPRLISSLPSSALAFSLATDLALRRMLTGRKPLWRAVGTGTDEIV